MLGYRIKPEADDNGTLLVACPLLPELTTFGDGEADAMRSAVGALEEAVAARMANGEDVPEGRQRRPAFRATSLHRIRRIETVDQRRAVEEFLVQGDVLGDAAQLVQVLAPDRWVALL
jgi:predicted RNase H-like HicB family nuclease